ncbi:hypothetical protein [uncultured Sphingomonas sp.]|uniref:hypothetical protein n=1 Tax=uncultured Sphingomonas sp. TaxID=158754 RepID=UPI0025D226FD|nr:hypothetical protein [uncultured Sphingomonas sp.]
MHAGLDDAEPRGRDLVWIMLANRATRGLASLYVQANAWDLAKAGQFHASWTPRGFSDADSPLVGFEQLPYLRQPAYGTSYITGKRFIALAGKADKGNVQVSPVAAAIRMLDSEGAVPFALYPQP